MKWTQIILLSIFMMLLSPVSNHAAIIHPSQVISQQQVGKSSKKVKKPRKKLREWLKDHKELLIIGGIFSAGLSMFILGLVLHIKWLWLTSLLAIFAPMLLSVIFIFLIFAFVPRRKAPVEIEESSTGG